MKFQRGLPRARIVAVARIRAGSDGKRSARYQRPGLKMSKSSADCQLALMRSGACQRGPMVLLRSLLGRTCNHTRAPEWPDTPRATRSSCARKELIKVTVGATCIFDLSRTSRREGEAKEETRREGKGEKERERLDPIQCSAKVLCNRSSATWPRGMFLPPAVGSARQAVSTSVNISDACSGPSNTCLINRIIRRARASLKVHLSAARRNRRNREVARHFYHWRT